MTKNYAIVYKDNTGLFYWERSKFEVLPNASVMAIFKGEKPSVDALAFINTNKGKTLKPLSPEEIADLL